MWTAQVAGKAKCSIYIFYRACRLVEFDRASYFGYMLPTSVKIAPSTRSSGIASCRLCRTSRYTSCCDHSSSPEELIDWLEHGEFYPPADIHVDISAICGTLIASNACDPSLFSSSCFSSQAVTLVTTVNMMWDHWEWYMLRTCLKARSHV